MEDVRPHHITMHGYIYQVFEEPAQESDWASYETALDCLNLLPVADSVDPVENRGKAIRRFGTWLEQNQLGMLLGTFFILDKMAADRYFEGRFKAFHKVTATLHTLTEEQYIHEYGHVQGMIDELRRTFCDPFRDYLLLGETVQPITLDEFIRTAEPGVRYDIGGVLDYHS